MPALSIRELDADVIARFNAGARARGWTQAHYLAQLVALHDKMRKVADSGDEMWAKEEAHAVTANELEALGLQTVTA